MGAPTQVAASWSRQESPFLETLFELWSKPYLKLPNDTWAAVLLYKPVSSSSKEQDKNVITAQNMWHDRSRARAGAGVGCGSSRLSSNFAGPVACCSSHLAPLWSLSWGCAPIRISSKTLP